MPDNPIAAAFAATPHWMLIIRQFDGLEIHPCTVVGGADEQQFIETCEPNNAQFWTVYGHFSNGRVDAFEDFSTAAEARAFANKLLQTYPHLTQHGLFDPWSEWNGDGRDVIKVDGVAMPNKAGAP